MTLRAIDDSSNTLALVSALRSSVFGCGDDDLFTYHVEHGGKWNVALAPPEDLPLDDPVAFRYPANVRHRYERLSRFPGFPVSEQLVEEAVGRFSDGGGRG